MIIDTNNPKRRKTRPIPTGSAVGLERPSKQTVSPTPNSIPSELLESCLLWSVLALSSKCVWNQLVPQHGWSWQSPWWTFYAELAMIIAGQVLASTQRIPYPGAGSTAPAFLILAWLQTITYFSSDILTPQRLHLFKLLFFGPLLSFSMFLMSRTAFAVVQRFTPSWTNERALFFLPACSMAVTMLLDWCTSAQAESIIRRLPYQWLPSGFALPLLTTIIAAGIGAWSTSRQQRHIPAKGGNFGMVRLGCVKFILACLPAVLFNLFFNTHSPLVSTTNLLNKRLSTEHFELLARGDGRATGYTSVLQQNEAGFRALRCDHSLLGGFWLNSPGLVKDPIYGVFVILEAVRLVVPTAASKADLARHAELGKTGTVLNIGLGIGTAPAAFIAHGMDVTIVEIDQIVYDFAIEYFELPPRHTAIIGDAIEFVTREQQKVLSGSLSKPKQYDFIVHDVFTGGVEPAVLFTAEFLIGLRDLLHDHGTIAINYAGDFTLPSAQMVLRTILGVFASCRIFRETETGPADVIDEGDQTNVVLFCRKQKGAWKFRTPEEADFLGSPSRKEWLVPSFEMDATEFMPRCAKRGSCFGPQVDQEKFLRNSNVGELEAWQTEAGKRHWQLMRQVLPPLVWDNW